MAVPLTMGDTVGLRKVVPPRVLSLSLVLSVITSFTFVTNLYIATYLPGAIPPEWTDTNNHDIAPPKAELMVKVNPNNTTTHMVTQRPIPTHEGGDLIHIVTTRFMQFQSHLHALGEARLRLFETFCLPSMMGQSIDDYMWFVLTDPSLHPSLLQRLLSLLSARPNFYLVFSQNNTFAFKDLDYLSSKILTGDPQLLRSAILSQRRKLYLQTRVDADDALSRQAIAEIQDKARSIQVADPSIWQIVCVNIHFEWRNDDLSFLSASTNTPSASGDRFNNGTAVSAGRLRVVQEKICVTPGFTQVAHRKEFSLPLPVPPRIGHHEVVKKWPECDPHAFKHASNCWSKLSKYPTALRSRTITSAGMSRIDTVPKESFYDNNTEVMWKYVERDFGISPKHALQTSQYLQDHFFGIVQDNLRGQW